MAVLRFLLTLDQLRICHMTRTDELYRPTVSLSCYIDSLQTFAIFIFLRVV